MTNPPQPPFKVIIVGGSIAGLTLAHCLQRAHIEHIILEKGNEIAPQLGASIGLMPNGGRVLEQLDLLADIERVVEPLHQANVIFPDGFEFINFYPKVVGDRFGFPIAFLDRQKFLEILYEKHRSKQNILTGKKVTEVRRLKNGTAVVAADGSVYEGDLVVGADGVHSRIRSEMWRMAEEGQPGFVSRSERTCMTVEYTCAFGISSRIPGLEINEQVNGVFDHLSVLTIHGRHGRVFWFVIQKLDRKYVYPDVPRFSEKDAEHVFSQLKDMKFWKDVTVGDLWKNREVFSMTALEEGLFKTWHHDRMVLAGDSVHKMTPNFGQGANCAIEDVATLSSLLHDLINVRGIHKPSNTQVDSLLQQYQQIRYTRMDSMCRTAASVARMQARDGWFNTVFARYWAPYAGNVPADIASKVIADAEAIAFLPLPERSGSGWEIYGRKRKGAHTRWAVILTVVLLLGWLSRLFVKDGWYTWYTML
ncbi:monooxygenase [Aspergillus heteromorphus CBS 117.55]|uniref:Monooxygenase n=1 Tax=Aspergillus heteromorphus CBS 117.55 TaxID=1448321 RepID=A0A317VV86_9EURO|nr:monooxygenase [Aspergillus heteromorphus CBS 117.55]PWY78296.1 monooxygenase [Aspergillus heteromorphus CBS 117.55]